ncbi:MAG TPA: RNA-binding protein [Pirellulales bacterium]|jgi:RNA recognition motif-containing protein
MSPRVFVSNLPYNVTQDDLRDAAGQFATVTSVHIPQDAATGRSRGFAFLGCETVRGQQRIIEGLNGYRIGGRELRAEAAQERPRQTSHGEESRSLYQ